MNLLSITNLWQPFGTIYVVPAPSHWHTLVGPSQVLYVIAGPSEELYVIKGCD